MSSNISNIPLVPVILAGGKGVRLWPCSTDYKPKHFLALNGAKTLLEQTLNRCKLLAFEDVLIIGNADQRLLLEEQIEQSEITNIQVLLEPFGRDSALPLALALLQSIQKGQDPVLCVMPADAVVLDTTGWKESLERAKQLAIRGYLTVIGLTPTRPETSYGYIKSGDPIQGIEETFVVSSFTEKPNSVLAKEFIKDDKYSWNSGIFVVQASVLQNAFKKYAPNILEAAEAALSKSSEDSGFIYLDKVSFTNTPSISFDYAIMEHIENAAVVKASFGWTDLGNWKAVKELSPSDHSGNVVQGLGYIQNGSNNYLKSDDRMVAINGLDNIGVIATKTGVLVSSLDKIQDIKGLVKGLKSNGFKDPEGIVLCPWGSYETLFATDGHQIKRICVKPQKYLSLQKHEYRSEHWIVLQGTALVTIENSNLTLEGGHSCDIPAGVVHRLENSSTDTSLIILEIAG